jgi:hypothetical protein
MVRTSGLGYGPETRSWQQGCETLHSVKGEKILEKLPFSQ